MVRILVVDDNPAVRRYLRTILEQQSEWRVCGEARTGKETLQIVQNSIPDVILLDFQLPDQNGLEVAREIHRLRPATPILMVTIHMSNQLAAAAKSVGIRGICAKSDVGSIEEAVQTLLDDKMYFPRVTSAEPMRSGSELEEYPYSQIQCFLYSMAVTLPATLGTPSDTQG